MMHALTVSVLLISEALCSCAPGMMEISGKLEAKGLIIPDTRKAMRFETLRACFDPEYVDRWFRLVDWKRRDIPNRELEREYSRVVRQTHEGLRGRRGRR
jgi:hypothetical protein